MYQNGIKYRKVRLLSQLVLVSRSGFDPSGVQFQVPSGAREHLFAYHKQYQQRSQGALKALAELTAFPSGICAIVLAYQETHTLELLNPGDFCPIM
jgi:hypothetical protein